MKTYIVDYKKTILGFARIEADSLEEAKEYLKSGDVQEFDNNSDIEYEEIYEDI